MFIQILSLFVHFKAFKKVINGYLFLPFRYLTLILLLFPYSLSLSTYLLQFQKHRFDPNNAKIAHQEDVKPSVGVSELNTH